MVYFSHGKRMTRAETKPKTGDKKMKFANTTYRGFEIITSKSNSDWTIIDENGSGHVYGSLADCKEAIDGWLK